MYYCKKLLDILWLCVCNYIDNNASFKKSAKPKTTRPGRCASSHALHPHPEKVRDEAFQQHDFLDPRDSVQVRYEMLRRHRIEGKPISEVARAFGISRQAFYVTDATFSAHGIPGLLPRRRGPKAAHKCTDEVLGLRRAMAS